MFSTLCANLKTMTTFEYPIGILKNFSQETVLCIFPPIEIRNAHPTSIHKIDVCLEFCCWLDILRLLCFSVF